MVHDRNNLLKELRLYVLEVFLSNGTSHKCTLQHNMLPKKYVEEEQQQEVDFHSGNPKMIATWNVQTNRWVCFSIDDVVYTQILDV